ncbi:hypothetical protein SLS54_008159 [Diplodia seriata]
MPFPETLKDLEHWVGATGFLQSKVPYYATIIKPLTDHKTELLRKSPVKGNARLAYTKKTKVVPEGDRRAARIDMTGYPFQIDFERWDQDVLYTKEQQAEYRRYRDGHMLVRTSSQSVAHPNKQPYR